MKNKTRNIIKNSNYKNINMETNKKKEPKTYSLINMIEISKPKERSKKRFIRKDKTNINLKKKIICNSNTINHIPVINNNKNNNKNNHKNNSTINSQINILNYFDEDSKNNKNLSLNSILFNFTSNAYINKNYLSLNNFFPMKNKKKENNKSCNNKISENMTIKNIKNTLYNTLYTNKIKNDITFEEEYNNYKTIIKNKNLKNKITYTERTKTNTKSFFRQYNNFINDRKKNIEENYNELLINNFLLKRKPAENENKNNKNNLFKFYSTKNSNNSFLFGDCKNDEILLNNVKSKSIKETNKQKCCNENSNNKFINQLNNNLCNSYKSNYSSFSCQNSKNRKNSSIYLLNNIYNDKNNINNYYNNKYYGKNFQRYIERKGDKILSEINNYHIRYKKEKDIIFPANPFDYINSKNINKILY